MRLVHLSDLHLGFRAYLETERGWNVRERDLAGAFRWALQETVRLEPDLVLITGDVFDQPSPPSTAFLTIHRGVTHLRAHLPAVPILVIAGERDTPRNPADPGPVAVLDALPGVEAAAGAPRAVRFRGFGLHALLLPFRSVAHPPYPEVKPDKGARWNILLVRGHPTDLESAIPVDPADWSYVGIGGSHRQQAWAPNVWAAGALERPLLCPWREATEEKGFLSFDLESGEAEFHPVQGRPVMDLAPVRVAREDPEAGTRRLRELLQGVPGGIEGKIVRVRLRGDVLTPNEGIQQGLLDAIRRRSTHLEVHVDHAESERAAVGDRVVAAMQELVLPDHPPIPLLAKSGSAGVTLLTSRSEAERVEILKRLLGGPAKSSLTGRIALHPGPPEDSLARALWGGDADPEVLLRSVMPLLGSSPSESTGVILDDDLLASPRVDDEIEIGIPEMERELTGHRADWVEASGDLEVAALGWAQERQDADSKLQAYRDRASELRVRMRTLENEKERSTCPTCGRTLGVEFQKLLETLRGEWENVVQDGRWWKRRREQLDEKPEELRKLEEQVLRLQVRVEEAAERLERMRGEEVAMGRSVGVGDSAEKMASPAHPNLSLTDPGLRHVLRRTGSLLSRITEGQLVGVRLAGSLRVVTAEGHVRDALGFETAALSLAMRLALWIHARGAGVRVGSLLVGELHETHSYPLFRGALEVLRDPERCGAPVLLVAPPSILEIEPEAFDLVVEVSTDGQGRQELIQTPLGQPSIGLQARSSTVRA